MNKTRGVKEKSLDIVTKPWKLIVGQTKLKAKHEKMPK
jgi:hypothetical protein